MGGGDCGGGAGGRGRMASAAIDLMLFLHQAVDVVLGAVLRRRHLEHERHAQQRFVRFLVGDDLRRRVERIRWCGRKWATFAVIKNFFTKFCVNFDHVWVNLSKNQPDSIKIQPTHNVITL